MEFARAAAEITGRNNAGHASRAKSIPLHPDKESTNVLVIMPRSAKSRTSEATRAARASAARTAGMLAMLGSSLAAQQTGIDGVVIDQVSGAPLERVHVSLYGGDPRQRPDLVYGAMSDKSGHISITGMKPGRY